MHKEKGIRNFAEGIRNFVKEKEFRGGNNGFCRENKEFLERIWNPCLPNWDGDGFCVTPNWDWDGIYSIPMSQTGIGLGFVPFLYLLGKRKN